MIFGGFSAIASADPASPHDALRFRPALCAVGAAVPDLKQSQEEVAEALASHWKLSGAKRERWRRIVKGSGVEERHGAVLMHDIISAGTDERMRLYQRHAPDLAERAARAALRSARFEARDITDLIIVSCTGFFAPGVDVALVDRLGLPRTVRRNTVGFMGCFGAITGLRAAIGACAAARDAIALVVCVELCSLHLRDSTDDDNLIASALFADGAAAAIVCGDEIGNAESAPTNDIDDIAAEIATLDLGASLLADHGRGDMTWRITDAGFAMTIDPSVPLSIERLAPQALLAAGIEDASRIRWLVHPGGPRILDAVEGALELSHGALDVSRRILRRFGNMSSATVLFVLQEALREGPLPAQAALLAFGPGLTIEIMPLFGQSRGASH